MAITKPADRAHAEMELDRHWKSVCTIMFGRQVGNLQDFREYLMEYAEPIEIRKSTVSGKPVFFPTPCYYSGKSFQSLSEVDFEKKYAPFSINEIKDIDSLIAAVQERIVYTGDMTLGNSKYIFDSTGVTDGNYLLGTSENMGCQYMAYCTTCSLSDNMFGCQQYGRTQFCIHSAGILSGKRGFETFTANNSSDTYYCCGLDACHECMFCFNVKNKKYAIGNLELPKDKYLAIKKSIIAEIAGSLEQDKRAPTLIDIFNKATLGKRQMPAISKTNPLANEREDPKPVQDAYAKTSEIILGKSTGDIDRHYKWLAKYLPELQTTKSRFSGRITTVPKSYANYGKFNKDRVISIFERDNVGDAVRMDEKTAAGITLKNASKAIADIAYICPDYRYGNVANLVDSFINYSSMDCYRSFVNIESKKTAVSYVPRSSESIFGVYQARFCSFCIKCYRSARLHRCFEVDMSSDCADCFYCHNCENLQDSMFCFNVKNKKYAIGNVEVGREQYMKMKKMLIDWILKKQETGGGLDASVMNLKA